MESLAELALEQGDSELADSYTSVAHFLRRYLRGDQFYVFEMSFLNERGEEMFHTLLLSGNRRHLIYFQTNFVDESE